MLLEANAGTGKTHALVHWVLRLIVETEAKLPEVLVVTFTDRACEELRFRVSALLLQAEYLLTDDAVPNGPRALELAAYLTLQAQRFVLHDLRLKLRLARQSSDLAQIRTIHGFARQSLADFADLRVEELVTTKRVLTDSVLDTWRQLLTTEESSPCPLSALYSEPEEIVRELLPIADTMEHAPPAADDRREAHWQALIRAVDDLKAIRPHIEEHLNTGSTLRAAAQKALIQWFEAIDAGRWTELLKLKALSAAEWTPKSAKLKCPDAVFVLGQALDAAREPLRVTMHEVLGTRVLRDFQRRLELLLDERRALRYADLILQLRARVDHDLGFRQALQQRFRHVLIDEFQDTDAAQLQIFQTLFASAPSRLLGMIGDPKQSIYAFRGADLSVYLAARRELASAQGRLARNFRSRASLVEAVNTLFSGADSFAHPELRLRPSEPDHAVTLNDRTQEIVPAMIQVQLDQQEPEQACADWIQSVLATQRFSTDRPLTPADFAVLVRRNDEAEEVAAALAKRGLFANLKRHQSVLTTAAADHLVLLLRALERMDEPETRRAAWPSPWIGVPLTELSEVSPVRAERLLLDMRSLAAAVEREGVAAALAHRLPAATARALANGSGAQWQVDSAHLLTLLADAPCSIASALERLITLRGLVKEGNEDRDTTRARPTALAQAVTVCTIHAAKGLEFPIVLLPSLFSTVKQRSARQWSLSPQGALTWCESETAKSQGSSAASGPGAGADVEDRRLAYVALTRAALLNVLIRPGDKPDDRLMSALVAQSAPDWSAFLAAQAEQAPNRIALESMPDTALVPVQTQWPDWPLLPRPVPLPALQVESFSSLRAGEAHGLSRIDRPAMRSPAADESGLPAPEILLVEPSDIEAADQELALLGSLRGTGFGDVLHGLLEVGLKHPERWPEDTDWIRAMAQLGVGDASQRVLRAPLVRLLQRVLETPVGPLPALADLADHERATEFGFDLAIRPFLMPRLVALLRHHGYAECAELLEGQDSWRGLLTGSADLVCHVGGRFFVCDYKSNWLGARVADYAPVALGNAMRHGQYRLQYLIYLLALDRHLRQRLGAAYVPEQQLGGAVYLFVRGIGLGPSAGVFVDTPPLALIQGMADLMLAGGTDGH
ncbi:MAG: UvrD-helicase domain-containing protein [Ahniella sp.]|nr:UvrD-helicase domain-containing protein [Ahniella sp.]